MDHSTRRSREQTSNRDWRVVACSVCAAVCAVLAGCLDWSALKERASASADSEAANAAATDDETSRRSDPFADTDIKPSQKPYSEAARPFIEAIVDREYAAAFEHLAPSAREELSRNQFALAENEREFAQNKADPVVNPTAEQFAELMQKTEARFGPPQVIDYITVETGADVLTRSDRVMAAFELGNMPDTIPVASRKAAVQAWVYVAFSDEEVRALAKADGITEDEVRNSRHDYEGPYFKIRTVVVDEGNGPVVGYFEIAPPSIWD